MAAARFTSILAHSSTTATDRDRAHAKARNALLHTLFIEAFQTERSADVHSSREADRFGCALPALALRAVADHARGAIVELTTLAMARGFSDTRCAMAVGSLFSSLRDRVADHFVDRERSYRGTLLGMRHGLDVMRSLRFAAGAAGDSALVAYCDAWLATRAPLVEAVALELSWFARNPERALEGAKGSWGRVFAIALRGP